jgi:putative membrane-bound dehydrogenase-like protein
MKPARVAIACAVGLVCAFPARAADEARVKPLQVLLVCGGCCHDYDAQKVFLAKGLEERAHVQVTVVQQGGTATTSKIPLYENENWSEGFDVVIHDECFSDAKEPEWTARILNPHKAGLPAVVLHCAMHCYRDGTDEWFKFCGVTSRRHGAAYAHEVLNRDAKHPIMEKFGPAWMNPAGELYWIEKVWDTAHPLAASKNKEKGNEEVCVWTNEYGQTPHGKGRVFGTTLGHHNETVAHPAYLDLVTRGTLWACDKLNDQYLKPVKPRLVPNNLALKGKATASSEEKNKNNFAANAIDGNMSTRWCADGPGKGEWLQIDLGEPKKVTGCRLDWEGPGSVYSYVIETSTDAKTWKAVVDASDNKAKEYTHKFDAPETRYLRVTFLGADTGAWGSLWEVSVFGDKLIEVNAIDARHDEEKALLAEVKVPEGFDVTVYAAPPAVNYPVFVAATPNGDVYVAVDKNGSLDRAPHRGAIHRLRDIDGDGRADEVKLFVPDVDSPRGLVWDDDRLYVLHPPHLSAYIDKDGDGIADEEKVLVKDLAFSFKDRPADHTSNGVTLGIDGWLYLAIGDFGFLEATGADGTKLQFRGGGVVRVRPDGTELEVYSRGTRNILEVALDPLLNGFARDNTNDGGGWDIRLHHLSGMDHHGYPSLFRNFQDEIVRPLDIYGGGSGCGALFLDEPGFPEGFENALYTADWGREWIYRHRMKPSDASFSADQTEFIRAPRVTDLDVDALSRLYVTSWRGASFTYAGENVGFMLQVKPKDYRPDPLPDYARLKPAELIAAFRSPSHRRRLAAQRALVKRGLDAASLAGLKDLALDIKAPLASRVAAIFALKQGLKERANPLLVEMAARGVIREFALRALTDRKSEMNGVPVDPIVAALTDPSPRVRRQAAVSLARARRRERAGDLVPLVADSDHVVAHTAVAALVELDAPDACFAVVDRASAKPAERAAALRVLQQLHEPAVVAGLIARLERENDASRRAGLVAALCRLHFREGHWEGESWGTRPDTSGPYYKAESWSETPKIADALQSAFARAEGDEAARFVAELSRHKVRLDDALEKTLALAAGDSALVPAAVQLLAGEKEIPAPGISLLIGAATGEKTGAGVRAQAIGALCRVDGEASLKAVLVALPLLECAGKDSPEFGQASGAFLGAPQIANRPDVLVAEAARLNGASSRWADAGLLALCDSAAASPEARQAARSALDAGWTDSRRRIQILEGVLTARHRPSRPLVLAALSDPDKDVAAAAAHVAEKLKFVVEYSVKPSGPPLEKIAVDEALDAAQKTKGDPAFGEELYTRLNCTKCHTLRQSEPARGPFLGNIANTYKRRELAEAILVPSKTIAQGFATQVFLLDDGRSVTGFVVQEAADKVVIRNSEGQELTIPAATIEERGKQALSMMPEGLVKEITLPEFASLLDYLESLAKPAK